MRFGGVVGPARVRGESQVNVRAVPVPDKTTPTTHSTEIHVDAIEPAVDVP